ncbi:MAG: hypothetical protein COV10_02235 [Candidatus Vogelbacteria bacterium CG10_big_fil_rev_8_21_14_0_10_51_16]|uniref:Uncharacterized protein n=1 Tax=Candidatus Vogelbacteria bacterium CG10_big_fil_rev_8_21_14_0_10_51_16 TaxID=1975045 RepID=A0A2H0REH5_9BACT|nr:MAG: hypothetical protein COV10_02235 [Candidatus Vogelbacteria bacterium CG10_big_fil_rev_8_21_14_0_10_51_16]
MKTSNAKVLGELSRQLVEVGSELPKDQLQVVKASGMVARVLRANRDQLASMRRAHDGGPEPRPQKSGLILPEGKLVEATALDFATDMFPDCRVGAAVQMGLDFGVPIEETLAHRGDPTRVGAVTSGLFTEANYPTSHPGVVWANIFAVNHGRHVSDAELRAWPEKIKIATGRDLRYASAKVEAQALQAAPRPAFDGCYPLLAYGNLWTSADGDRYFLRAYLDGGSRHVDSVWDNPRDDWHGNWWFPVLEYLEALVL